MSTCQVIFKKKNRFWEIHQNVFFYPKFDAFSFQNVFQYLFDFACKTRENVFIHNFTFLFRPDVFLHEPNAKI